MSLVLKHRVGNLTGSMGLTPDVYENSEQVPTDPSQYEHG